MASASVSLRNFGSMSIVGVETKHKYIGSRVGVKAPARFLCMAEEDSVSKITEITHPEADAFQDFGFVVAAFNKAV